MKKNKEKNYKNALHFKILVLLFNYQKCFLNFRKYINVNIKQNDFYIRNLKKMLKKPYIYILIVQPHFPKKIYCKFALTKNLKLPRNKRRNVQLVCV